MLPFWQIWAAGQDVLLIGWYADPCHEGDQDNCIFPFMTLIIFRERDRSKFRETRVYMQLCWYLHMIQSSVSMLYHLSVCCTFISLDFSFFTRTDQFLSRTFTCMVHVSQASNPRYHAKKRPTLLKNIPMFFQLLEIPGLRSSWRLKAMKMCSRFVPKNHEFVILASYCGYRIYLIIGLNRGLDLLLSRELDQSVLATVTYLGPLSSPQSHRGACLLLREKTKESFPQISGNSVFEAERLYTEPCNLEYYAHLVAHSDGCQL